MGKSLVQKILEDHLVEGRLAANNEVGLRIDQTLTQDATGTTAYLEFEAMEIPRVRTRLSVSYVDHNMLQTGFENADDHRFLQTIAARYGICFSRPGNGICHQVHLERFAEPGATLLGSDSHTPTSGGIASLAIGAGGLDVAVAMGGGAFYITMPKVVGVELCGRLPQWVTAKDIILEMLRRLKVTGGIGRIFEYHGDGICHLSVPERGTITNMGAELGATTSIFPSDQRTLDYLRAQGREAAWKPLAPDPDAAYDERITLELDRLEPLMAQPSSPDRVVPVRTLAGTKVDQVAVGSCTNSSFHDLMTVAAVLRGQVVSPGTSLVVTPGSRQVLEMIARAGGLADMIAAGARILESACGPCIGMGQAPPTGAVSVRSFNRNFPGRSGTPNDRVYLASPETAAASAIRGVITDPRELGDYPEIAWPEQYLVDDRMILAPSEHPETVEIVRGPNIKPLPAAPPMAAQLAGPVLIKAGDNVSTDVIMPAGAKILPLRSNIPAISEYVFAAVDPGFARRARQAGGGFIVGGANYGQGSSREHAALAPMALGVRAVIAKSLARIHAANLVNFGILPLTFSSEADYDRLRADDRLEIPEARAKLAAGEPLSVKNATQGYEFPVRYALSERQRRVLLAGGLLNSMRNGAGAKGESGLPPPP
jgi:predicted aconitate hydratase